MTARPTLNLSDTTTTKPDEENEPKPYLRGCESYQDIQSRPQSDFVYMGKGAFGNVYRVGTDYVLKRITIPNATVRALFLKEAATWNELAERPELALYMPRLCWTKLLTPMEYYAEGWILTRYEETQTLEELIRAPTKISQEKGIQLVAHMYEAVRRLNAAGYIHRDLTPRNILVRKGGPGDGIPILIDFGLVCKYPCVDLELVGTLGYVPQNWLPKNRRIRTGLVLGKPNATTRRRRNSLLYQYVKNRPRPLGPGAEKASELATQPHTLSPRYNAASDAYMLGNILEILKEKINFTEAERRREMDEIIAKLRYQIIPSLAANLATYKARARNGEAATASRNAERTFPTKHRSWFNVDPAPPPAVVAPRTGTRKRTAAVAMPVASPPRNMPPPPAKRPKPKKH